MVHIQNITLNDTTQMAELLMSTETKGGPAKNDKTWWTVTDSLCSKNSQLLYLMIFVWW